MKWIKMSAVMPPEAIRENIVMRRISNKEVISNSIVWKWREHVLEISDSRDELPYDDMEWLDEEFTTDRLVQPATAAIAFSFGLSRAFGLPTQSELQTWMRDNLNVHVMIGFYKDVKKWKVYAFDMMNEKEYSYFEGHREFLNRPTYDKYEDALEIGLVEGLQMVNIAPKVESTLSNADALKNPADYECWIYGEGWSSFEKYVEGYNSLSDSTKLSWQDPAEMKLRKRTKS